MCPMTAPALREEEDFAHREGERDSRAAPRIACRAALSGPFCELETLGERFRGTTPVRRCRWRCTETPVSLPSVDVGVRSPRMAALRRSPLYPANASPSTVVCHRLSHTAKYEISLRYATPPRSEGSNCNILIRFTVALRAFAAAPIRPCAVRITLPFPFRDRTHDLPKAPGVCEDPFSARIAYTFGDSSART